MDSEWIIFGAGMVFGIWVGMGILAAIVMSRTNDEVGISQEANNHKEVTQYGIISEVD